MHSHVITLGHLDSNKILSDAQHRFMKTRSCESQLILTIQDLANVLKDGEQIDAILLDFSKAIDKVAHQMLLGNYGITASGATLTGLLISWLTDSKKEF